MPTPKEGYRLKDGTRVPGTTTIINRFKDSGGLMYWAFEQGRSGASSLYEKRDQAADTGTFIHALIEAHINGIGTPEVPPGMLPDDIALAVQGFESFRAWEEQTRFVVVEQEMGLVSELHHYGGTPDGIAMVTDALAMIDWKSSRGFYYDYLIQLAAYLHLYQENYPTRELTGGIHIIRFGKTGTDFSHHHYAANHPALELAWRQFLLFREAYDIDRALKKRAA